MGIRLIVEVLDHAPQTLTHREKLTLTVLAEDANDETRRTWSSVEAPMILRRCKVTRSGMYEVLKGLVAKGALEKTTAGQKNVRAAEYRLLPLAPQCPGSPDTEGPQCPGIPDPEPVLQGPENPDTEPSQCPENPDAEPQLQGPGNPDTDGSQCLENPDTYPSIQKRDSSPHPPAPSAHSSTDGFAEFWETYPRKIGKGHARKAWAAAIKGGADPAEILAAAARHADAWKAAHTDQRFIPHPTTWLHGERYDDADLPTAPAANPQQPPLPSYADQGIF
ncbi:hypothetical protein [Phaeacidiphilus oryzae]|uniref:hypothetical protein n=1 Tax=Phaeacidiphilus oryzae TaxID=348818 RepID=UPI000689285D|nr:hypothetical protein [Phaeacidiphilus oryzae]